jgi:hypothetical protein
MWHEESLSGELFAQLMEFDRKIAGAVASRGCSHCGGALHQGNYQRKPRGGRIGTAGEAFTLRHSLCCGREGCRKRALPPSLRFLGRRVYLEAVILIATLQAMMVHSLQTARQMSGVPIRTLRRWHGWWTETFPRLNAWTERRALFVPPPPEASQLPKSLLDRLCAQLPAPPSAAALMEVAGRFLAPVTTESVADGSRFVRHALGI